MIAITPAYAALLALLYLVLSVRTLLLRRALRIAVGDGGSAPMLRAMRVHANFAEYVPLALILVMLVEFGGAAAWLVHGLCTCLLLGRIIHAWGLSRASEDFRYRVAGMSLTFTALGGAALVLLFAWLRGFAS